MFGVSVVIGAGIFTVTASTFGNIHANLATAFSLNGIHWAATIISIGALAGVALLIALAATAFPMSKLEEMVNVGTLFAFFLVSAGVIVLRRTCPDLDRGFKAPFVPALPIVSIVA